LRAAIRCLSSKDPLISETGAILVACLLAFIWCLNFDNVAGAQSFILLWVILGFAIGLHDLARSQEQLADSRERGTAQLLAPSNRARRPIAAGAGPVTVMRPRAFVPRACVPTWRTGVITRPHRPAFRGKAQ
jgi:hypothetical protein